MSIYTTKYVINTFLSKWRAIVALFLCICIILHSVTITISADKDSEKNVNSSKENISVPLGESGNTQDSQQAETSNSTQQPQVSTSPSGIPIASDSQVVLDLFSPPPSPPSTIFSSSILYAPLTLYGPPAMSYIPIPNMGVRRSYSSPAIGCNFERKNEYEKSGALSVPALLEKWIYDKNRKSKRGANIFLTTCESIIREHKKTVNQREKKKKIKKQDKRNIKEQQKKIEKRQQEEKAALLKQYEEKLQSLQSQQALQRLEALNSGTDMYTLFSRQYAEEQAYHREKEKKLEELLMLHKQERDIFFVPVSSSEEEEAVEGKKYYSDINKDRRHSTSSIPVNTLNIFIEDSPKSAPGRLEHQELYRDISNEPKSLSSDLDVCDNRDEGAAVEGSVSESLTEASVQVGPFPSKTSLLRYFNRVMNEEGFYAIQKNYREDDLSFPGCAVYQTSKKEHKRKHSGIRLPWFKRFNFSPKTKTDLQVEILQESSLPKSLRDDGIYPPPSYYEHSIYYSKETGAGDDTPHPLKHLKYCKKRVGGILQSSEIPDFCKVKKILRSLPPSDEEQEGELCPSGPQGKIYLFTLGAQGSAPGYCVMRDPFESTSCYYPSGSDSDAESENSEQEPCFSNPETECDSFVFGRVTTSDELQYDKQEASLSLQKRTSCKKKKKCRSSYLVDDKQLAQSKINLQMHQYYTTDCLLRLEKLHNQQYEVAKKTGDDLCSLEKKQAKDKERLQATLNRQYSDLLTKHQQIIARNPHSSGDSLSEISKGNIEDSENSESELKRKYQTKKKRLNKKLKKLLLGNYTLGRNHRKSVEETAAKIDKRHAQERCHWTTKKGPFSQCLMLQTEELWAFYDEKEKERGKIEAEKRESLKKYKQEKASKQSYLGWLLGWKKTASESEKEKSSSEDFNTSSDSELEIKEIVSLSDKEHSESDPSDNYEYDKGKSKCYMSIKARNKIYKKSLQRDSRLTVGLSLGAPRQIIYQGKKDEKSDDDKKVSQGNESPQVTKESTVDGKKEASAFEEKHRSYEGLLVEDITFELSVLNGAGGGGGGDEDPPGKGKGSHEQETERKKDKKKKSDKKKKKWLTFKADQKKCPVLTKEKYWSICCDKLLQLHNRHEKEYKEAEKNASNIEALLEKQSQEQEFLRSELEELWKQTGGAQASSSSESSESIVSSDIRSRGEYDIESDVDQETSKKRARDKQISKLQKKQQRERKTLLAMQRTKQEQLNEIQEERRRKAKRLGMSLVELNLMQQEQKEMLYKQQQEQANRLIERQRQQMTELLASLHQPTMSESTMYTSSHSGILGYLFGWGSQKVPSGKEDDVVGQIPEEITKEKVEAVAGIGTLRSDTELEEGIFSDGAGFNSTILQVMSDSELGNEVKQVIEQVEHTGVVSRGSECDEIGEPVDESHVSEEIMRLFEQATFVDKDSSSGKEGDFSSEERKLSSYRNRYYGVEKRRKLRKKHLKERAQLEEQLKEQEEKKKLQLQQRQEARRRKNSMFGYQLSEDFLGNLETHEYKTLVEPFDKLRAELEQKQAKERLSLQTALKKEFEESRQEDSEDISDLDVKQKKKEERDLLVALIEEATGDIQDVEEESDDEYITEWKKKERARRAALLASARDSGKPLCFQFTAQSSSVDVASSTHSSHLETQEGQSSDKSSVTTVEASNVTYPGGDTTSTALKETSSVQLQSSSSSIVISKDSEYTQHTDEEKKDTFFFDGDNRKKDHGKDGTLPGDSFGESGGYHDASDHSGQGKVGESGGGNNDPPASSDSTQPSSSTSSTGVQICQSSLIENSQDSSLQSSLLRYILPSSITDKNTSAKTSTPKTEGIDQSASSSSSLCPEVLTASVSSLFSSSYLKVLFSGWGVTNVEAAVTSDSKESINEDCKEIDTSGENSETSSGNTSTGGNQDSLGGSAEAVQSTSGATGGSPGESLGEPDDDKAKKESSGHKKKKKKKHKRKEKEQGASTETQTQEQQEQDKESQTGSSNQGEQTIVEDSQEEKDLLVKKEDQDGKYDEDSDITSDSGEGGWRHHTIIVKGDGEPEGNYAPPPWLTRPLRLLTGSPVLEGIPLSLEGELECGFAIDVMKFLDEGLESSASSSDIFLEGAVGGAIGSSKKAQHLSDKYSILKQRQSGAVKDLGRKHKHQLEELREKQLQTKNRTLRENMKDYKKKKKELQKKFREKIENADQETKEKLETICKEEINKLYLTCKEDSEAQMCSLCRKDGDQVEVLILQQKEEYEKLLQQQKEERKRYREHNRALLQSVSSAIGLQQQAVAQQHEGAAAVPQDTSDSRSRGTTSSGWMFFRLDFSENGEGTDNMFPFDPLQREVQGVSFSDATNQDQDVDEIAQEADEDLDSNGNSSESGELFDFSDGDDEDYEDDDLIPSWFPLHDVGIPYDDTKQEGEEEVIGQPGTPIDTTAGATGGSDVASVTARATANGGGGEEVVVKSKGKEKKEKKKKKKRKRTTAEYDAFVEKQRQYIEDCRRKYNATYECLKAMCAEEHNNATSLEEQQELAKQHEKKCRAFSHMGMSQHLFLQEKLGKKKKRWLKGEDVSSEEECSLWCNFVFEPRADDSDTISSDDSENVVVEVIVDDGTDTEADTKGKPEEVGVGGENDSLEDESSGTTSSKSKELQEKHECEINEFWECYKEQLVILHENQQQRLQKWINDGKPEQELKNTFGEEEAAFYQTQKCFLKSLQEKHKQEEEEEHKQKGEEDSEPDIVQSTSGEQHGETPDSGDSKASSQGDTSHGKSNSLVTFKELGIEAGEEETNKEDKEDSFEEQKSESKSSNGLLQKVMFFFQSIGSSSKESTKEDTTKEEGAVGGIVTESYYVKSKELQEKHESEIECFWGEYGIQCKLLRGFQDAQRQSKGLRNTAEALEEQLAREREAFRKKKKKEWQKLQEKHKQEEEEERRRQEEGQSSKGDTSRAKGKESDDSGDETDKEKVFSLTFFGSPTQFDDNNAPPPPLPYDPPQDSPQDGEDSSETNPNPEDSSQQEHSSERSTEDTSSSSDDEDTAALLSGNIKQARPIGQSTTTNTTLVTPVKGAAGLSTIEEEVEEAPGLSEDLGSIQGTKGEIFDEMPEGDKTKGDNKEEEQEQKTTLGDSYSETTGESQQQQEQQGRFSAKDDSDEDEDGYRYHTVIVQGAGEPPGNEAPPPFPFYPPISGDSGEMQSGDTGGAGPPFEELPFGNTSSSSDEDDNIIISSNESSSNSSSSSSSSDDESEVSSFETSSDEGSDCVDGVYGAVGGEAPEEKKGNGYHKKKFKKVKKKLHTITLNQKLKKLKSKLQQLEKEYHKLVTDCQNRYQEIKCNLLMAQAEELIGKSREEQDVLCKKNSEKIKKVEDGYRRQHEQLTESHEIKKQVVLNKLSAVREKKALLKQKIQEYDSVDGKHNESQRNEKEKRKKELERQQQVTGEKNTPICYEHSTENIVKLLEEEIESLEKELEELGEKQKEQWEKFEQQTEACRKQVLLFQKAKSTDSAGESREEDNRAFESMVASQQELLLKEQERQRAKKLIRLTEAKEKKKQHKKEQEQKQKEKERKKQKKKQEEAKRKKELELERKKQQLKKEHAQDRGYFVVTFNFCKEQLQKLHKENLKVVHEKGGDSTSLIQENEKEKVCFLEVQKDQYKKLLQQQRQEMKALIQGLPGADGSPSQKEHEKKHAETLKKLLQRQELCLKQLEDAQKQERQEAEKLGKDLSKLDEKYRKEKEDFFNHHKAILEQCLLQNLSETVCLLVKDESSSDESLFDIEGFYSSDRCMGRGGEPIFTFAESDFVRSQKASGSYSLEQQLDAFDEVDAGRKKEKDIYTDKEKQKKKKKKSKKELKLENELERLEKEHTKARGDFEAKVASCREELFKSQRDEFVDAENKKQDLKALQKKYKNENLQFTSMCEEQFNILSKNQEEEKVRKEQELQKVKEESKKKKEKKREKKKEKEISELQQQHTKARKQFLQSYKSCKEKMEMLDQEELLAVEESGGDVEAKIKELQAQAEKFFKIQKKQYKLLFCQQEQEMKALKASFYGDEVDAPAEPRSIAELLSSADSEEEATSLEDPSMFYNPSQYGEGSFIFFTDSSSSLDIFTSSDQTRDQYGSDDENGFRYHTVIVTGEGEPIGNEAPPPPVRLRVPPSLTGDLEDIGDSNKEDTQQCLGGTGNNNSCKESAQRTEDLNHRSSDDGTVGHSNDNTSGFGGGSGDEGGLGGSGGAGGSGGSDDDNNPPDDNSPSEEEKEESVLLVSETDLTDTRAEDGDSEGEGNIKEQRKKRKHKRVSKKKQRLHERQLLEKRNLAHRQWNEKKKQQEKQRKRELLASMQGEVALAEQIRKEEQEQQEFESNQHHERMLLEAKHKRQNAEYSTDSDGEVHFPSKRPKKSYKKKSQQVSGQSSQVGQNVEKKDGKKYREEKNVPSYPLTDISYKCSLSSCQKGEKVHCVTSQQKEKEDLQKKQEKEKEDHKRETAKVQKCLAKLSSQQQPGASKQQKQEEEKILQQQVKEGNKYILKSKVKLDNKHIAEQDKLTRKHQEENLKLSKKHRKEKTEEEKKRKKKEETKKKKHRLTPEEKELQEYCFGRRRILYSMQLDERDCLDEKQKKELEQISSIEEAKVLEEQHQEELKELFKKQSEDRGFLEGQIKILFQQQSSHTTSGDERKECVESSDEFDSIPSGSTYCDSTSSSHSDGVYSSMSSGASEVEMGIEIDESFGREGSENNNDNNTQDETYRPIGGARRKIPLLTKYYQPKEYKDVSDTSRKQKKLTRSTPKSMLVSKQEKEALRHNVTECYHKIYKNIRKKETKLEDVLRTEQEKDRRGEGADYQLILLLKEELQHLFSIFEQTLEEERQALAAVNAMDEQIESEQQSIEESESEQKEETQNVLDQEEDKKKSSLLKRIFKKKQKEDGSSKKGKESHHEKLEEPEEEQLVEGKKRRKRTLFTSKLSLTLKPTGEIPKGEKGDAPSLMDSVISLLKGDSLKRKSSMVVCSSQGGASQLPDDDSQKHSPSGDDSKKCESGDAQGGGDDSGDDGHSKKDKESERGGSSESKKKKKKHKHKRFCRNRLAHERNKLRRKHQEEKEVYKEQFARGVQQVFALQDKERTEVEKKGGDLDALAERHMQDEEDHYLRSHKELVEFHDKQNKERCKLYLLSKGGGESANTTVTSDESSASEILESGSEVAVYKDSVTQEVEELRRQQRKELAIFIFCCEDEKTALQTMHKKNKESLVGTILLETLEKVHKQEEDDLAAEHQKKKEELLKKHKQEQKDLENKHKRSSGKRGPKRKLHPKVKATLLEHKQAKNRQRIIHQNRKICLEKKQEEEKKMISQGQVPSVLLKKVSEFYEGQKGTPLVEIVASYHEGEMSALLDEQRIQREEQEKRQRQDLIRVKVGAFFSQRPPSVRKKEGPSLCEPSSHDSSSKKGTHPSHKTCGRLAAEQAIEKGFFENHKTNCSLMLEMAQRNELKQLEEECENKLKQLEVQCDAAYSIFLQQLPFLCDEDRQTQEQNFVSQRQKIEKYRKQQKEKVTHLQHKHKQEVKELEKLLEVQAKELGKRQKEERKKQRKFVSSHPDRKAQQERLITQSKHLTALKEILSEEEAVSQGELPSPTIVKQQLSKVEQQKELESLQEDFVLELCFTESDYTSVSEESSEESSAPEGVSRKPHGPSGDGFRHPRRDTSSSDSDIDGESDDQPVGRVEQEIQTEQTGPRDAGEVQIHGYTTSQLVEVKAEGIVLEEVQIVEERGGSDKEKVLTREEMKKKKEEVQQKHRKELDLWMSQYEAAVQKIEQKYKAKKANLPVLGCTLEELQEQEEKESKVTVENFTILLEKMREKQEKELQQFPSSDEDESDVDRRKKKKVTKTKAERDAQRKHKHHYIPHPYHSEASTSHLVLDAKQIVTLTPSSSDQETPVQSKETPTSGTSTPSLSSMVKGLTLEEVTLTVLPQPTQLSSFLNYFSSEPPQEQSYQEEQQVLFEDSQAQANVDEAITDPEVQLVLDEYSSKVACLQQEMDKKLKEIEEKGADSSDSSDTEWSWHKKDTSRGAKTLKDSDSEGNEDQQEVPEAPPSAGAHFSSSMAESEDMGAVSQVEKKKRKRHKKHKRSQRGKTSQAKKALMAQYFAKVTSLGQECSEKVSEIQEQKKQKERIEEKQKKEREKFFDKHQSARNALLAQQQQELVGAGPEEVGPLQERHRQEQATQSQQWGLSLHSLIKQQRKERGLSSSISSLSSSSSEDEEIIDDDSQGGEQEDRKSPPPPPPPPPPAAGADPQYVEGASPSGADTPVKSDGHKSPEVPASSFTGKGIITTVAGDQPSSSEHTGSKTQQPSGSDQTLKSSGQGPSTPSEGQGSSGVGGASGGAGDPGDGEDKKSKKPDDGHGKDLKGSLKKHKEKKKHTIEEKEAKKRLQEKVEQKRKSRELLKQKCKEEEEAFLKNREKCKKQFFQEQEEEYEAARQSGKELELLIVEQHEKRMEFYNHHEQQYAKMKKKHEALLKGKRKKKVKKYGTVLEEQQAKERAEARQKYQQCVGIMEKRQQKELDEASTQGKNLEDIKKRHRQEEEDFYRGQMLGTLGSLIQRQNQERQSVGLPPIEGSSSSGVTTYSDTEYSSLEVELETKEDYTSEDESTEKEVVTEGEEVTEEKLLVGNEGFSYKGSLTEHLSQTSPGKVDNLCIDDTSSSTSTTTTIRQKSSFFGMFLSKIKGETSSQKETEGKSSTSDVQSTSRRSLSESKSSTTMQKGEEQQHSDRKLKHKHKKRRKKEKQLEEKYQRKQQNLYKKFKKHRLLMETKHQQELEEAKSKGEDIVVLQEKYHEEVSVQHPLLFSQAMSELREQQKAEREKLIVSSSDSDTTSDTSDLEETDGSSKDQYPEKKGDGDGKPDPDRGGASSKQYQGLVYYVTADSTPVFPYGSKLSLPFPSDKGKNEGKNEGKQQTLQCGDGGYESDSQESGHGSGGNSPGEQSYVLQEPNSSSGGGPRHSDDGYGSNDENGNREDGSSPFVYVSQPVCCVNGVGATRAANGGGSFGSSGTGSGNVGSSGSSSSSYGVSGNAGAPGSGGSSAGSPGGSAGSPGGSGGNAGGSGNSTPGGNGLVFVASSTGNGSNPPDPNDPLTMSLLADDENTLSDEAKEELLVPLDYNENAIMGSLDGLQQILHTPAKSIQSAMNSLALQSRTGHMSPNKRFQAFASIEGEVSSQSGNQNAYTSQFGVVIHPVPNIRIGLAYNYSRDHTDDLYGIRSKKDIGFAKSKVSTHILSSMLVWNAEDSGFTAHIGVSYGLGQVKNIRYMSYLDDVIHTKGRSDTSMLGGIAQLGYALRLPKFLLTPYIELSTVNAWWKAYGEEYGLLASDISRGEERIWEKSMGLRTRWSITDNTQWRVWSKVISGQRKSKELTATLKAPFVPWETSTPNKKKTYSQLELGTAFDIQFSKQFGIGVNGSIRFSKKKEMRQQNAGMRFWYNF